jgi:hypothetical protein
MQRIVAQRIVLGLVIAIGGATGVVAPVSAQEYRGTWEQQMACTPDVWRLCGDQIPDVDRIVACLRQNKPQLSGGCRAVFESQANAQQQQQSSPRGSQQNAPRARAPQPGQPQAVRPRPTQPAPYPAPYEEENE